MGLAPEAGTQALPHSARCVRVHPTPDHPTNVHLGFRNLPPAPYQGGCDIRIFGNQLRAQTRDICEQQQKHNLRIFLRGLAVQFAHRRAESAAWRNTVRFSIAFALPKVVSLMASQVQGNLISVGPRAASCCQRERFQPLLGSRLARSDNHSQGSPSPARHGGLGSPWFRVRG